MKARLLLALCCALGMLVATGAQALAIEPAVVVNTERPEFWPTASPTFLAWAVESPHFNRSVRAEAIGSDTSFRVNPKGTYASPGGIDGSRLLYSYFIQGDNGDRTDLDLVLFDLSTQTELEVPDGINTDAAEYSPSISGSHILFGRSTNRRADVVLFDTTTSASEIVYSKRYSYRRALYLTPAQVNGNYAVWEQLVNPQTGDLSEDVFLYDISAATTTRIPSPDGKRPYQYGPSVDVAGTVYFGRSNSGCGENTHLVSRDLDGTETVLYEFPAHLDFESTYAVSNPNTTTDLYFDRGRCHQGVLSGNIWKLSDV
jgi:hypothetical protein